MLGGTSKKIYTCYVGKKINWGNFAWIELYVRKRKWQTTTTTACSSLFCDFKVLKYWSQWNSILCQINNVCVICTIEQMTKTCARNTDHVWLTRFFFCFSPMTHFSFLSYSKYDSANYRRFNCLFHFGNTWKCCISSRSDFIEWFLTCDENCVLVERVQWRYSPRWLEKCRDIL